MIHRYWNNAPYHPLHWVVFDKTVYEDFRWPMVHIELWISAVVVLMAWLIAERKTRTLRILLRANLWISGIDIFNYVLFFRRQEWFLRAEFVVMLVATVLIFYHASTTRKNEKTC